MIISRKDYASVTEAAQAASDNPSWSANFSFNVSRSSALQWARIGNEALVEASERYMDQFEALLPATDRTRWSHDIAGSFPNVARFLAGSDPRVMRRKRMSQEEHAPVRIYVDIAASGGISNENYQKRGSAILAFVRLVSIIRPVELFATHTSIGDVPGVSGHWDIVRCPVQLTTIPIPSNPLNVSLAAAWISSPDVYRALWINQSGYSGGGGFVKHDNSLTFAEMMGLGPSEFYIPGAYLHDPIILDPITWIKARLAEITQNIDQD